MFARSYRSDRTVSTFIMITASESRFADEVARTQLDQAMIITGAAASTQGSRASILNSINDADRIQRARTCAVRATELGKSGSVRGFTGYVRNVASDCDALLLTRASRTEV